MSTGKFLRMHAWCQCERSCNTALGAREDGLSVYECTPVGSGVWKGTGAAYAKMMGQGGPTFGDPTWYLVTGTNTGNLGGDKEPLLQSVVPEKLLRWNAGSQLFEENGSPNFVYSNHENYPNCKCESVDDQMNEDNDENTDTD